MSAWTRPDPECGEDPGPAPVAPAGAPGWSARLELDFAPRGERTVLRRRRHAGPLMVQSAFHPEGPVCHVYVLHPPGGVVGGDRLTVEVDVAPDAHALITTPSAAKLYRSAGPTATVTQRLRVAGGGALEWLPQEAIVFDGARARLDTRVDLGAGARFVGWDLACLGRPAGDAPFERGALDLRFEIRREGRPLLVERLRVTGGAPVASAPWGLDGHVVLGTLVATGATVATLAALRAGVGSGPGERVGATIVDGLLVCRCLAGQAHRVRERLEAAWSLLRPALIGRAPCPPRIWAT